jgi:hypothetical protein
MSAFIRYLLLASAVSVWSVPALADISLEESLALAARSADPRIIRLAVEAATCASAHDQHAAQHLAVIDYSRPSTEPRLWVFDLTQRKLIYEELVAHGRNSGENYARSFSNEPDSHASSLGLFRTQGTYVGHNGYSLRMSGLEPGFNDRAEQRAIVMHGASYVNGKFVKMTGRLGRSQGCPAVRPEIARAVIDSLKDGQYIFAYYPDQKWLASSPYLGCGSKRLITADNAAGALMQASSAP